MKPVVRWAGYGLLTLFGLVVVAGAALYGVSEYRIRSTYDVHPAAVAFQADEETIARGRHVATIRGCVDCHSENLGGKLFFDAPGVGRLYATNLTRGEGGAARTYTNQDWVRAIRHGIAPNGRPLLFMPSHEFYPLSDEDLGSLIAYLQSVPAVEGRQPRSTVGPIGRALFLAGQVPLLPAEMIDHAAPRPTAPQPGVTVEYGEYLSTGCIGCHGPNYGGGRVPGTPPEFPAAANLTPHETGLAGWTEADFFRALREGKRPDGTEIDPIMPVALTAQMTDEEIRAMWLYMQSLPPRPYGSR